MKEAVQFLIVFVLLVAALFVCSFFTSNKPRPSLQSIEKKFKNDLQLTQEISTLRVAAQYYRDSGEPEDLVKALETEAKIKRLEGQLKEMRGKTDHSGDKN